MKNDADNNRGQGLCAKCNEIGSPIKSIADWVSFAPKSIVDVLCGVIVLNFLREHRNTLFQLPGMHDGSISDECRKRSNDDYRAMNEFIVALKKRRVT